MFVGSKIDSVGDLSNALTLPRALKLLMDPRTPLSQEAPGIPGRAYRCFCASADGSAADAVVPVLSERIASTKSSAGCKRCAKLLALAASRNSSGVAHAVCCALKDSSCRTTQFGALRLLLTSAEESQSSRDMDGFWKCTELVEIIRCVEELAKEDVDLGSPRRMAATASDTLCWLTIACIMTMKNYLGLDWSICVNNVLHALNTVIECEVSWFSSNILFVDSLVCLRSIGSSSTLGLIETVIPYLLLLQSRDNKLYLGDSGVERALDYSNSFDSRSVILLCFLLGRRHSGAGFDEVISSSSIPVLITTRLPSKLHTLPDSVRSLALSLLYNTLEAFPELFVSPSQLEPFDSARLIALELNSKHKITPLISNVLEGTGGCSQDIFKFVLLNYLPTATIIVFSNYFLNRSDFGILQLQESLCECSNVYPDVVCLMLLIVIGRISHADNAEFSSAVTRFLAAKKSGSGFSDVVLSVCDICIGNASAFGRDLVEQSKLDDNQAESFEFGDDDLYGLLVKSLENCLSNCDPDYLIQLFPFVVITLLSRPDSLFSIQIMKSFAAHCTNCSAESLGIVLHVLVEILEKQRDLDLSFIESASEEDMKRVLFDRVTPLLFVGIVARIPVKDGYSSLQAVFVHLCEIACERLTSSNEYSQVRTAAQQALLSVPESIVLPILSRSLERFESLSECSMAAALQALLSKLQQSLPAVTSCVDCDHLARVLCAVAAEFGLVSITQPASLCITLLAQAQVHDARKTGPVPHSSVLDAILSSINSVGVPVQQRRVCAAVTLDIVRSMVNAPRDAVAPLLKEVASCITHAAGKGHLQDTMLRVCCVDALACIITQSRDIDLFGSDDALFTATELAVKEVNDTLNCDEKRCLSALTMLVALVVQRQETLFGSRDETALKRLSSIMSVVERVAIESPAGSSINKLAVTVLRILSGQ